MLSRAPVTVRVLPLSALLILVLLVAPPGARGQSALADTGSVRTAVASAGDTEIGELKIVVGRSALVNVGQPITRVSLTRPEIADAVVTGVQQILVHGKAPGTISMFVWDRSGGTRRYDVTVSRDLGELAAQMKQLFPGEDISVSSNGKTVVVSGAVTNKYVMDKAAEVAAGYVEKKEDVVNLLKQREGIATNQILLRVRFAEVSRNVLTELGASLFTGPGGFHNYLGRATTQQFAAPTFENDNGTEKLVFSDFLNLFLFNSKEQLGAVVKAMQNRGLFQSLAEPNLIAENGKEASFLAGGEYPYPAVQGTGGNLSVTIVFKEYGVRLNFTPTITGSDLVHLKVRPEVSTLDFNNAVTYQGFRIPALNTRRAETEIELQDGQTFAIAGLLDNTVTSTLMKIPGIGDIPILGLLFRSKAAQKAQTELVVMITPQILRRGSTGAAPGLPNMIEPFLAPDKKSIPPPAPRMPGAPIADAAVAPPQPVPAAAAPAPVGAELARPVSAPAAPPAAVGSGGVATQTAPPTVTAPTAQAAPVAPPIDKKKLAEQQKAEERAAKELKKKQEADGRALAKQQIAEAKQRAEEAKRAEQQRQVDAKKAEEQRKVDARLAAAREKAEAKLAEERRKAEAKRAEEQRKLDAKQAEERKKAEAKQAREQLEAEQHRLDEARKAAERAQKLEEQLLKERASRDSAMARQIAENQRIQAEVDQKRVKEIQAAQDRLREAQAAYAAALERAKKAGQ